MPELSWGLPGDYEEIVAFADRAFGDEVQPGGFASVLPKIYRNHPEAAARHLLLREEGRLRALLLCDRKELRIGGESLSAACIGTVSVSHECRGRGYMGLLLREAQQQMRREGCAFAALGGQRQRYERFGYYPAGLRLRATLTQANLTKCSTCWGASSLTAEPMPSSGPMVSRAADLHRSGPAYCVREEGSFTEILRSWRAEPYLLLREGEFAGYLTLAREPGAVLVTELSVEDPALLTGALSAIGAQLAEGGPVRFSLSAADPAADLLAGVCEEYSLGCSQSFQVLDFPALSKALLRLRAELSSPRPGEWAVPVEGSPFLLSLSEDGVDALPSAPPEKAGLLTAGEATQLLFSPRTLLPASFPAASPPPAGWLPLPLFLPSADGC